MTTYNTCRLCSYYDFNRPVFRYGIRHYCHAECGFEKWGVEFLRKIPAHQVGQLPYRLILDFPDRLKLAQEIDHNLHLSDIRAQPTR